MLFVVSNQPDVARGTQTEDAVREINRVLATELPLDAFYMCYHDDADRCECRKPLPGLLEQARGEHDIDLRASYMIGDRWRDIDAGAAAGCATILIDRGYDERRPNSRPQAVVRTIGDAAQAIFLLEEKGSPKA
jgi:D-glycero-D-manno-heptose 1,7-bisphosphate phosphatase